MPEATRFNDIINNEFSNTLDAYSGTTFTEVEVYVEGFEDIGFWYSILAPYEKRGIRFKINIPSITSLKTGKVSLLNLIDEKQLGEKLILCTDSDYDYLFQNSTENSRSINTNNFIFQTYTYSIENLYCYHESLRSVLVQATKNTGETIVDIPQFMIAYSSIVYQSLLWNIYFYRIEEPTKFTVEEFCEIIRFDSFVDIHTNGSGELNELKERVNYKINELHELYPNETTNIESLKVELTELGLNSDTAYLFLHGHTLKDNVVLMLLNPIYNNLKNDVFKNIRESDAIESQVKNARVEFKTTIMDINKTLELNTEFKECFLFKKLKEDLDNYVDDLLAAPTV